MFGDGKPQTTLEDELAKAWTFPEQHWPDVRLTRNTNMGVAPYLRLP